MEKPILNSIKLNKDMTLTISNFPGVKEDVEEFWDRAGNFYTGIVSAYEEGEYLAYDGYFYHLPPNFFHIIETGSITLQRAHAVKDAENLSFADWYLGLVPGTDFVVHIQDGAIVDMQATEERHGDMTYLVVDTTKPSISRIDFAVNGVVHTLRDLTHDPYVTINAVELLGTLHRKVLTAAALNTKKLLRWLSQELAIEYDEDTDTFPLYEGQEVHNVVVGDNVVTIYIDDADGDSYNYCIPTTTFISLINDTDTY